jgi:hypothetical protein
MYNIGKERWDHTPGPLTWGDISLGWSDWVQCFFGELPGSDRTRSTLFTVCYIILSFLVKS